MTQGCERAAGGAPAGQIPARGGRAQERAAERTGSDAWRVAARGRERAGGGASWAAALAEPCGD